MNESTLLEHLWSNASAVILKWSEHFNGNDTVSHLPIRELRPESLTLVFNDLIRVLEGQDLNRVTPVRQRDVLLETTNVCSKLPLLVELFLGLEEVLTQDLLINGPDAMENLDHRLQFEQLSGAVHLLFQVHLESFCEYCVIPLREGCSDLLKRRSVEAMCAKCDTLADLPSPIGMESNFDHEKFRFTELSKFLVSHSDYLPVKWWDEASSCSELAETDDLEGLVATLYEYLEGNCANEANITTFLEGGEVPNQEFKNLVKLCHLGEEVIALFLAEVPEKLQLRLDLNRAFHSIIRTFASSSCTKCQRQIRRAKNALALLD